jgi:hypothetical protein
MFAAFVPSEVIICMLGLLTEAFLGFHDRRRARITDGDSAFIPARERVNRRLAHIRSAMHKEENLLKKLSHCGFAKDQRDLPARLFRQIAYSDHKGHANSCLRELREMAVPRLSKYIQKHMTPRLIQFAKSFIPPFFTCGLNASSAAESMNRLLKVGMRPNISLVDAQAPDTTRRHQGLSVRPGLDDTETLVHSRRLHDLAYIIRFDPDQNRYE